MRWLHVEDSTDLAAFISGRRARALVSSIAIRGSLGHRRRRNVTADQVRAIRSSRLGRAIEARERSFNMRENGVHMRVLILHNQPVLPDDHPDADSDQDILFTTEAIESHLQDAGIETDRLAVGRDPAVLLDYCRTTPPDVVFNLFEGLADQYDTEAHCVGLLEWLGIPYTGSPPQALTMARNKPLAKHIMRGAGLPTADFLVVDRGPLENCPIDWPVIVKPAEQDASVGLDQGSVVTNLRDLNDRIELLLERYQAPVLVERFIRGRELCVGVVENPDLQVLPVCEILFLDEDPDFWPIVTYDAKWKPGSRDFEATPYRYPAALSDRLARRMSGLAEEVFRLFGCRDYARVDFRVPSNGRPVILEVNPNPSLRPDDGLSLGLKAAGQSHPEFTVKMVEAAFERSRIPAAERFAPIPVR